MFKSYATRKEAIVNAEPVRGTKCSKYILKRQSERLKNTLDLMIKVDRSFWTSLFMLSQNGSRVSIKHIYFKYLFCEYEYFDIVEWLNCDWGLSIERNA